ncbi:MAG: helix-turn-helix domain-containing protein [Caldilineaceae bacterium]|nr:helix-turn-helix domain-containing protein [Caldilineaceae bacterium]
MENLNTDGKAANLRAADALPRQSDGRTRTLLLSMDAEHRDASIAVAKALGSTQRMRILDYLQARVANVSEIAEALGMPLSTANLHLNLLEECGLIRSDMISASRGVQKVCARLHDMIMFQLPRSFVQHDEQVSIQMPIGAFVNCQIAPTCGIAAETGLIGYIDDPISFYEPHRFQAQLIWFRSGFLEYHFPYRSQPDRKPKSLMLSMELCSEAPNYHYDWPSDVFMEINGHTVGTWTSPGDFGGERGVLTPMWWEEWNSQYGLLKSWRVDQAGAWIDGVRLSDVTIDDLELGEQPYVSVRFGVREDAQNVGGMNLFGRTFGNYPQDIMMQLHY